MSLILQRADRSGGACDKYDSSGTRDKIESMIKRKRLLLFLPCDPALSDNDYSLKEKKRCVVKMMQGGNSRYPREGMSVLPKLTASHCSFLRESETEEG